MCDNLALNEGLQPILTSFAAVNFISRDSYQFLMSWVSEEL
jgi:hypothetical protein